MARSNIRSRRQHRLPRLRTFAGDVSENRPRLECLETRSLLTIVSVTAINPLSPHPVAGTSYTGTVADFTVSNGDTGPFSATINWGDGHSTVGAVNLVSGNNYDVTGTHTYIAPTIAGQYNNVTVTITDANTPSTPSVADSGAIVDDATVTATAATAFSVTRGFSFTGDIATFVSNNPYAPASSFSAQINWGDGSPTTAGTILEDSSNTFHVVGTHAYTGTSSATYTASVTVLSVGGSTSTANTTVTVETSTVVTQAFPIVGTEGVALSNIVVATYSDTGGQASPIGSNYTAMIDWGDTTTSAGSIVALGGNNFEVTGTHTYALGGNYPVSISINSLLPNFVSPTSIATSQASIAWVPAVASSVTFNATEEVQFSGTVAAFTSPSLTTPLPVSDYLATINWGDGSSPTQGLITGVEGGYIVNGIHTYSHAPSASSFVYPVVVSIQDTVGHTTAQAVSSATVTPIGLAGQLNPSTDTGLSHYDAITKDNQPAFFGSSQPYSSVAVFAQSTSGGSLINIGQTQADGSGAWSLTSNVALPDGSYVITSRAVDTAGFPTGSAQILPNSTQGPLVVDTVGPKVTSVQFNPLTGQIAVTFQDDRSGLDQQTLVDGSNYLFTGRFVHGQLQLGQRLLITSLTSSAPSSPTSPQTVIATIDKGKVLRGGLFNLVVFSGSNSNVQDVAGNALDGEFYGYFPSGNNRPGGDFGARITFIHGHGSIPLPESSSASPNPNPGTIGTPFRVFRLKGPHYRPLTAGRPSSALAESGLSGRSSDAVLLSKSRPAVVEASPIPHGQSLIGKVIFTPAVRNRSVGFQRVGPNKGDAHSLREKK